MLKWRRILQWVTVLLPVTFLVVFDFTRHVIFPDLLYHWPGDVLGAGIVLLSTLFFSQAVFRALERMEAAEREDQRQALTAAGMGLAAELSLDAVLRQVVTVSGALLHARYGALSVLGNDGSIQQFITLGVAEAEQARIGHLPRGLGLLGVVIRERRPLRLADISRDPRARGFPPHHPPMTTLLAVPIIAKGKLIGVLYLADKKDRTPFTGMDENLLVTLASQAAIAIENARLYTQVQDLAVLRKRERIGMDLHDGIIQSLYAVGLGLEDVADQIGAAQPDAQTRLEQAIDDITGVIQDIRNYILNLRPQTFEGKDLRTGLEELAQEFQANSLVHAEVEMHADAPAPSSIATTQLLHIAREALMNVAKHARASQVVVRLQRENGSLQLEIQDNGSGFDPRAIAAVSGQGLRNIVERAQQLHGQATIHSAPAHGTRIVVQIPSEG